MLLLLLWLYRVPFRSDGVGRQDPERGDAQGCASFFDETGTSRRKILPAEWTCSVTTSCPVALAGCQLQVIQVVVVPPESDALGGTAVRYDPLVGEP